VGGQVVKRDKKNWAVGSRVKGGHLNELITENKTIATLTPNMYHSPAVYKILKNTKIQ
jgi:hypothetical protein